MNYAIGSILENAEISSTVGVNSTTGEDFITVQCFPLYSILLAVGRTTVDFFSLDVEGHELRILQTIPWHKVDIKVQSMNNYFYKLRVKLIGLNLKKN